MTRFILVTIVMVVFSVPLWAAGVLENFDNGSGGFSEIGSFSASNGRLEFRGDRTEGTIMLPWAGGPSPAGWDPTPSNSNYFEDFDVSVDIVWEGGKENAGYGLDVCVQKNNSERADYVGFYIDQSSYVIMTIKGDNLEKLVDWTPSANILANATNELSIFKIGNYFSFSINGTEVHKLTIDGCVGGAIAVEASNSVDLAFDNFRIIRLFIENFNSDDNGFPQDEYFSVSDGRFVFRGDGTEGARSLPWEGGFNPGGGGVSEQERSNYFQNFGVSVDARWDGGNENAGYGISVCNRKNSSGTVDYIMFIITGFGDNVSYYISTVKNGQREKLADWIPSTIIKQGEFNELNIIKNNDKFTFSINDTQVKELKIDNCGGSIDLEASKSVDASFDSFIIIDFPSSSTPTSTPTSTPKDEAPVASFTTTPSSGKAPATVSLDASASYDPDGGNIVNYSWRTSDSQSASDKTATFTFAQAGAYTIELVVTDDEGDTGKKNEKIELCSEENCGVEFKLEFQGLKDFYNVGEVVVVDLVQMVHTNRFEPVDLWVAVLMPDDTWLFKTDIPMMPFSPQPQAFKTSLDNVDTIESLLGDFEVPPGMGGDYTFYAVYVEEGKNPLEDGFAVIKEITSKKTTLAN